MLDELRDIKYSVADLMSLIACIVEEIEELQEIEIPYYLNIRITQDEKNALGVQSNPSQFCGMALDFRIGITIGRFMGYLLRNICLFGRKKGQTSILPTYLAKKHFIMNPNELKVADEILVQFFNLKQFRFPVLTGADADADSYTTG